MKTFKAKFNEAGNCIYCGESGRCPKYHNYSDTPRVFDNGGETTDRYTILLDRSLFAMSEDPLSPLGFNQYIGEMDELGWLIPLELEVSISSLPRDIQTAIQYRKESK